MSFYDPKILAHPRDAHARDLSTAAQLDFDVLLRWRPHTWRANLPARRILITLGSVNARVLVMGFTFKENVPDTRNTKVVDLVHMK